MPTPVETSLISMCFAAASPLPEGHVISLSDVTGGGTIDGIEKDRVSVPNPAKLLAAAETAGLGVLRICPNVWMDTARSRVNYTFVGGSRWRVSVKLHAVASDGKRIPQGFNLQAHLYTHRNERVADVLSPYAENVTVAAGCKLQFELRESTHFDATLLPDNKPKDKGPKPATKKGDYTGFESRNFMRSREFASRASVITEIKDAPLADTEWEGGTSFWKLDDANGDEVLLVDIVSIDVTQI